MGGLRGSFTRQCRGRPRPFSWRRTHENSPKQSAGAIRCRNKIAINSRRDVVVIIVIVASRVIIAPKPVRRKVSPPGRSGSRRIKIRTGTGTHCSKSRSRSEMLRARTSIFVFFLLFFLTHHSAQNKSRFSEKNNNSPSPPPDSSKKIRLSQETK